MASRATYAFLVLAASGAPFACGMPGAGAPGVWHFQVSDARAGCHHAFDVFVLPAEPS